jgi:HTH-type transcriptional regulator, glycine betaine synthesis regulator
LRRFPFHFFLKHPKFEHTVTVMAIRPTTEPADSAGVAGDGAVEIRQVEDGVIGLFVSLVHALGLPKSLGEIYGLLFVAPRPMAMDDIRTRLGISLGSASQGLRTLKAIRAVKTVYVAGDRRVHFEAETAFRQLIRGFYAEQVAPQWEDVDTRLAALRPVLDRMGVERGHYAARLDKLASWRRNSSGLLGRIVKLIAF